MLLDDLIEDLQKARAKLGNVEVKCSSSCGTNSGFVSFDIEPRKSKIKNNVNGYGDYCLSIEVSERSKTDIKNGIAKMISMGWRYFRSQFVQVGESPKEGLSPCDWHPLW